MLEQGPEYTSNELTTDSGDSLPVANPEVVVPTPEEQIQKGKNLTEYQDALTLDISNPEDPKFTPEQQKNIEIMEGLQVKYPHALIERVTDDGRKYCIVKTIYSKNEFRLPSLKSNTSPGNPYDHNDISNYGTNHNYSVESNVVMSDLGVSEFRHGKISDKEVHELEIGDWTAVLDARIPGFDGKISAQVGTNSSEGEHGDIHGTVEHINYSVANLDTLRNILMVAEDDHKDDEEPREPTAQEILDIL